MKVRNKKIKKLLEKYKEISILGQVNSLLGWDLNVNLPPKAAEGRAAEVAYITKLIAEKWLEKDFRNLLESLNNQAGSKSLNPEEAAIRRNLNWAGKYYYNVPKEIIVEFAETTSRAFMIWHKAKLENKFQDFLPHLKKIIKLNQIIANHLGFKENPYDALLDLYEPGLTASFCRKIFADLTPELTQILKKILQAKALDLNSLLDPSLVYPERDQKQLSLFVLRKMGYDLEAGRMDISPHPFTTTLGRFDVRITNRYKANDFQDSLMVAMHEGGHALYELGVNQEYANTPLDGGVSLGIHESQSRFWENQIGRSLPFIKFMTPLVHAFYPQQLSKVGPDELFTYFNRVKPGLIRVEADEVTYNLHIALRFELEDGLINNKLKANDLPEIWRSKMKKMLGVVPKTDREGVLQDVHWSYGSFGYFPTYTLGNLYGAQITNKMTKEINIEEASDKGELGTILAWLRANIHQYGSVYWPGELIKKITGEALNPKYFLDYIKEKYSKIYNFKL